MATVALSPEGRQDLLFERARRSFSHFLGFVMVQGDDPQDPRPIRMQAWDYQHDRAVAWAAGESEVVLKPRQIGMSWCVAAYMYWRAAYKRWEVGYYSSGEDPARKQLDGRVAFIEEHLPPGLRVAGRKSDMLRSYPGGGSIRAFPSTEHAGVGYTFQLVVADEAAIHEYGAINYAAYAPTLSAGGQFIALSTANPELGPAGFFYALWNDAVAGLNGYKPVFLPWWIRPDRHLGDLATRTIVPDPAWLERESRKYTAAPPGAFEAYFPATPGAAFVSRSGLVYGLDPEDGVLIFNPQQHPHGNLSVDPCEWRACKWHYGYVDWGGGDPTAAGLIGVTSSGRMHQFREFHRTGPTTVESIAEFFQRHAPVPGNDYNHGYDAIECGADEPNAIASLAALGLPAHAADTRRAEGLGAMASVLKSRRLTFNPERCVNAIREFDSYRWAESRNPFTKERYATRTPHGTHGDHKDGERYVAIKHLAVELSYRDSDYAYAGMKL